MINEQLDVLHHAYLFETESMRATNLSPDKIYAIYTLFRPTTYRNHLFPLETAPS